MSTARTPTEPPSTGRGMDLTTDAPLLSVRPVPGAPVPTESEKLQELITTLRPLYVQFFKDLDLTQPLELFESDKLKKAVLEFAESTSVPFPPNSHSYESLMVGYSYADNCFPYHDLETKVYVAIYTWLATLCDDAEYLGTVADIELFQQRYMLGGKQPTIILQAFEKQLRLSYKLYHPVVANLIVCSSFNLLTATALAARDGIKNKSRHPSKGGNSFSWYMRERGGVGEGYSWFTFPKSQYPDLDIPIEAIDDMTRFIAFVNDVLSFYKETIAGETNNYIHTKAAYDGGNYLEVLRETARDAVNCARRIESVLRGQGEYEKAWRIHATGYIQMHLMRGRYKLWEVGVGTCPEKEEALK